MTHKSNSPLRPIFPIMDTHNCNLAKFLVSIFEPLVSSKYVISVLFQFASVTRERTGEHNTHLVIVDVDSLHINVPASKTIKISLNKLFPTDSAVAHSIGKPRFESLLKLVVSDSYILCLKV